jgi:hypothetical protein
MSLQTFIEKIKNNVPVSFNETMSIISNYYDYRPTEFCNGLSDDQLINKAGTNEGSCKIFAFAKIHGLNQQQTLELFGDYYRLDVLNNPTGTNHQNIRNFMRTGWEGIRFNSEALAAR